MSSINIIFDGPPDHEGPRFVEIENDKGESIRIGEWMPDPRAEHEGYWRIQITLAAFLDLAESEGTFPERRYVTSDGTALTVSPQED